MRKIDYISPTRLKTYRDNPQEFYLRYLSDVKVSATPQNQAMSIGSSFDAYAKSFLYEALFGPNHDPRYSFESLFETQVEPHNRDWARTHGQVVMDSYILSGALADLAIDLQHSIGTPRFEIEITGSVGSKVKDVGSVIFLGKPDVFYINKFGAPIILDWKVNGYTSNTGASPMQGYVKCRDGWRGQQSRTHNMKHPETKIEEYRGTKINGNRLHSLNQLNKDWASQLAIYSWLCGIDVGDESIVAIDQIVCRLGDIRIAEHRTRVDSYYQEDLFSQALQLWEAVHSDWIFRDMTKEQSQSKCAALDEIAKTLVARDPQSQNQSMEEWIASFRMRQYS